MKIDVKKEIIQVTGMTCHNCSKGLENHLNKNGFSNVSVNFSSGEVIYEVLDTNSNKKIKKLIQQLGYTTSKTERISKTDKYFYISLLFTLPLILHMFLPLSSFLNKPIIQFFMCLPVYIVGILYFGKSAYNAFKNSAPNMDVLIFIGSTSAFFYSIYGSLAFTDPEIIKNYLFFETAATIITLVLLGNVLEKKSVKKTTSAIKDLTNLQNVNAKKYVNGEIIKTSYHDLKINDILLVNTGDKVPIDGIIISGNVSIDESMISGESKPVTKSKGNIIIGGTIINDGSVKIKITKNKNETVLSQIINLVKNAQNNQPKIQKIGDKVSSVFVPLVLLIAVLTFLIGNYFYNIETEDALLRAIAVLVISCPCAMGLATPTAIMVGVGRAAKNGILIKGGDTIEKVAQAKNIVFDKTGTLTNGKFIIKKFNVIKGDKNKISNIIYNIEQNSNHPIAKSLCNYFIKFNSPIHISNIKEEKGVSISAEIENNKYTIGSSRICSSDLKHDLFVLENKEIIATIDIEDEIKIGTKSIISSLHSKGYSSFMLSGDKKEKCDKIASQIGIKNIFGEQLPKDKLKTIDKLTQNGTTIMVGDGINDAPALAKSDVGISLSNATDIAIKSSDIVLLNSENLNQLQEAISIGKHTLLTIKQNLFWAFSYNIIAIPLAIMGLITPMWAALFMAFSDIVVIGNSIRLRYKNIF